MNRLAEERSSTQVDVFIKKKSCCADETSKLWIYSTCTNVVMLDKMITMEDFWSTVHVQVDAFIQNSNALCMK